MCQAAFKDVALFHDPCRGRFFRSSETMCIFWMSSRLLYYCFIHRAWTNYFNSSLWGSDWQLPSLEWSVCFSDWAKATWCILTIIGATATMMFSKPLCYFPAGCPRGMFEEYPVFRDALRGRTDGKTVVLCRSVTPWPNHHHHHHQVWMYALPSCLFRSSEKPVSSTNIPALLS